MTTYGSLRCPTCGTNIQTIEKVTYCPACKAYIADKVDQSNHEGVTTANATGPGLHPIKDVIQDVY
jgi:Zn finger protein HypA/HybF involved in hydrogenase expression